jgi:hypothetical protein
LRHLDEENEERMLADFGHREKGQKAWSLRPIFDMQISTLKKHRPIPRPHRREFLQTWRSTSASLLQAAEFPGARQAAYVHFRTPSPVRS